jgi:hypothetical protein
MLSAMSIREGALRELDLLIETGKRAASSYSLEGMSVTYWSKIPEHELRAFRTAAAATVERLVGRQSEFYKHLPQGDEDLQSSKSLVEGALGVILSLRDAVDRDLLVRVEQRVRSNTYDDFLTQAQELLAAKPSYHVAAMVLVGGVLEDQLRKMCAARSIQWKGKDGMSAYNDALKEVAHPQAVWRRVQVVADNRNAAAHGGDDAAKLRRDAVEDDLRWVRKFLGENVA